MDKSTHIDRAETTATQVMKTVTGLKKTTPQTALDLVTYLDNSWTAYHAVSSAASLLLASGFTQLDPSRKWPRLIPNGRYFYTRNSSSLVAFVVGGKARAGCGVAVVGAHTDSPCPKLKPKTKLHKSGHLCVACQPYGGGLWHTWFDRDLGVAGRAILNRGSASASAAAMGANGTTSVGAAESNGAEHANKAPRVLEHRLVKIEKPIMRIPTLAIHLDRGVNTEGMKVNVQQHLQPLLAMQTPATEGMSAGKSPSKVSEAATEGNGGAPEANGNGNGSVAPVTVAKEKKGGRHHPLLLTMLAEAAGCLPEDIADFELQLCDTQKASIGGALDEFIFSGRLDNLAMSFCSITALRRMAEKSDDIDGVMMAALFDHEEVGSSSAQGAGSTLMANAVDRIAKHVAAQDTTPEDEDGEDWSVVERSVRRSMVVSADMAHAVHPNYSDRHDSLHMPSLGAGVVIKHNCNQRYATDAVSSFVFRECGQRAGCESQDFVVRSDMACGSTIGPIISANTGLRTVDVGIPQLSMHSIREMCHVDDVDAAVRHFEAFYQHFWDIDGEIAVDAVGALADSMPVISNDVGCGDLCGH